VDCGDFWSKPRQTGGRYVKRSVNHISRCQDERRFRKGKSGGSAALIPSLILDETIRMSSLLPDSADCPVDFDYLKRMTLGEEALEREVLGMFLKQTKRLLDALACSSAETPVLTHTLKGSARAIGAFRLADRAAALEEIARNGGDLAAPLAALKAAAAEVRDAIDARFGRS
jgi:HPt (histidine-containing phosphotransfer) domain-containing protein